MRRSIYLFLVLPFSGCARHLYSVPEPTVPPRSTATATTRAPAPVIISSSAWADVIPYIIARSLAVPVAGVLASQLRDTFDEGRDGGRVHRALDILAPRGTPVISTDSGRILRISSSPLGGNTIYAEDPLGRVVYYYAHLDAYQPGLVQGAPVARGDTLGFVGTTGNAPKDTPHLHFQLMRMPADGKYWDGDAINPYPLFLLMHEPSQP